MTKKTLKNISASVHQRLLNKAKSIGRPFNELLQYFVIERFLYRLSCSDYSNRFILKGGLMFAIWQEPFIRPTRDVDMLGYGEPTAERLRSIVRGICLCEVVDDGLTFDADSIDVAPIRAGDIYDGVRIQFQVYLGQARIPMQLDVGFGDVVIPAPVEIQFPSLLDLPVGNLRGYSQESLIAEKFHAMVMRGTVNSRVKDFYDLWLLSTIFEFDAQTLVQAIQETFERRQTALPLDVSFLDPMLDDKSQARTQWQAFLRRNQMADAPTELDIVVKRIEIFLQPLLSGGYDRQSVSGQWNAPGPWSLLQQ